MKRLATAASLSLIFFAADAFAQCRAGAPARVAFERGHTTAVVNGALPVRGDACYTLRAQGGQWMRVSVNSVHDIARFNVFAPVGERTIAHEAEEWGGALPATGRLRDRALPRPRRGGRLLHARSLDHRHAPAGRSRSRG